MLMKSWRKGTRSSMHQSPGGVGRLSVNVLGNLCTSFFLFIITSIITSIIIRSLFIKTSIWSGHNGVLESSQVPLEPQVQELSTQLLHMTHAGRIFPPFHHTQTPCQNSGYRKMCLSEVLPVQGNKCPLADYSKSRGNLCTYFAMLTSA